MVLFIICSGLTVLLTITYLYIKHKYRYWEKKKIPYAKPSLIFGNFGPWIMQKECWSLNCQRILKQFPNEQMVGAYFGIKPVLMINDPEAVKNIMVKEFSYFNSREAMNYMHQEPFGMSVAMNYGEEWKFARNNLAPMFTTMKLKNMYPLLVKCSDNFKKYLDIEVRNKTVEARELMSSYTMSVFVSTAFGIDLDDFAEKNTFHVMGESFFGVDWFRGILISVRYGLPEVFYGIGLRTAPKKLTDFIDKLLTEVFESRNYKHSGRNDFVDALLALKEIADKKKYPIRDDFLIAQCLALFLGGFETSASTLSFLLYELAKHEDVQAKVHAEIDGFLKKTGGQLSFECMSELPYTEACIAEALRMYPIVGVITREVTQEFTLPSGAVLEKETRVQIPVYHFHYNPKYFPKPEQFMPERFYGEAKREIVPYSYIPFGEGPRFCLGKRFASMQSLSGLITVLRDHRVVLADGMTLKPKLDPRTITTQIEGGIHLKLLARK